MALESLKELRLPKLQELERYWKDPEILTSEILFTILTLSNVFVVYRVLLDVIPYPIFVTWWQISQGLLMAYILGEGGIEFPKLQYFPRVEINKNLCKKLLVPTLVNILMLIFSNIILYRILCIATLPIIVSFSVVLHHITRFVGCGEEYMPLRWYSILFLFLAFLLGTTDTFTISSSILPYALLYALFSSSFRAAFLQKVMHIVDGRGNLLHNHQHFIGFLLIPVLILLSGEYRIFLSSSLLGIDNSQTSLTPTLSSNINNTMITSPSQFLWSSKNNNENDSEKISASLFWNKEKDIADKAQAGLFSFGSADNAKVKLEQVSSSLFGSSSSKIPVDQAQAGLFNFGGQNDKNTDPSKAEASLFFSSQKNNENKAEMNMIAPMPLSSSFVLPSASLVASLSNVSMSWFGKNNTKNTVDGMSSSFFTRNEKVIEDASASVLSFNFFTSLQTLQVWGCLITVGTLPFLKNIVSNRLIRRTGQGPWRFLEILSIVFVFLLGLSFGVPGWQGFISIIFVLVGRTLGALDVLINAQEMENNADDNRRGGGGDGGQVDYNDIDNASQTSQKPFLQPIDEENQESDDQEADYGESTESE